MLVSIGKAAEVLGVCIKTLRRYDAAGIIKPFRTAGNHRRYDLEALERYLETHEYKPRTRHSTKRAAVYARVSSHKQKNDLQRQKEFLEGMAKEDGYKPRTYYDIGSGLNDRRPQLLKLLRHALMGKFDIVYVTYLDRLARFGTFTIISVLDQLGIDIIPVHVAEDTSFEKTLVNDMIALVTSFAGKVHRSRRGKNKKKDTESKMAEVAQVVA